MHRPPPVGVVPRPAVGERSLDPEDWPRVRALAHQALDEAFDSLQFIRDRPVWRQIPDDVRAALNEDLPVEPQGLEKVYEDFRTLIFPYPTGNIHPRFFGWVHGTGMASGVLAEMMSAAMNSNCGGREHAAIHVERCVLDWCKRIVGFPKTATGLIVSGTSMATMIGLATARNARVGYDMRAHGVRDYPRQLVAYTSSEAHESVVKAFEILGLGRSCVRAVPVDPNFQADLAGIESAVEEDLRAGLEPFCVIGTAGTVNTGALDDLAGLAAICRRHNLWFHVDGAFGALCALSEELRPLLSGIELADSLSFDFHKWMYVQYDAGCVLVRHESLQRQTFSSRPAYLGSIERGLAGGGAWPCEFGPELSRGFRALKVWFALKEHGSRRLGEVVLQNCRQAAVPGGTRGSQPGVGAPRTGVPEHRLLPLPPARRGRFEPGCAQPRHRGRPPGTGDCGAIDHEDSGQAGHPRRDHQPSEPPRGLRRAGRSGAGNRPRAVRRSGVVSPPSRRSRIDSSTDLMESPGRLETAGAPLRDCFVPAGRRRGLPHRGVHHPVQQGLEVARVAPLAVEARGRRAPPFPGGYQGGRPLRLLPRHRLPVARVRTSFAGSPLHAAVPAAHAVERAGPPGALGVGRLRPFGGRGGDRRVPVVILKVPEVLARLLPDSFAGRAVSVVRIHTTRPVYLAFLADAPWPACAVQFGSGDALPAMHDVLSSLHRLLPDNVPDSLACAPTGPDGWVLVQAGVRGTPWFRLRRSLGPVAEWLALRELARTTLERLHQAVQQRDDWHSTIDPGEELRRQVRQFGQDAWSPALFARLDAAIEKLPALPRARYSWQHGDYCLNNLVVLGQTTGVIDFEEFGQTAVPLHDEFSLALSFADFMEGVPARRRWPSRCATAVEPALRANPHWAPCCAGLFLHHLLWRMNQCRDRPTRAGIRDRLAGLLARTLEPGELGRLGLTA